MAKMVEIDEEDLRKSETLRNTIGTLMSDPETKLLLQQAVKKKFPNAVTPELDAATVAANAAAPLAKDFEAFKKEVTEQNAKREHDEKLRLLNANYDAGFDKLRRDGWTAEGIDGVKKIMEEKGILDHEIAAAYFEKQHPPQDLITPNGRTGAWNFMDGVGEEDADLKKLIETKGENIPLLDKMTRDALVEVRGQSQGRR